jgi:hypothetical protein
MRIGAATLAVALVLVVFSSGCDDDDGTPGDQSAASTSDALDAESESSREPATSSETDVEFANDVAALCAAVSGEAISSQLGSYFSDPSFSLTSDDGLCVYTNNSDEAVTLATATRAEVEQADVCGDAVLAMFEATDRWDYPEFGDTHACQALVSDGVMTVEANVFGGDVARTAAARVNSDGDDQESLATALVTLLHEAG